MSNTYLYIVTDYKYLSMHLDQNLDYSSHIRYQKNKISQRHYLLKKVFCFLEALLIFKSSILPYFA